MKSSQNGQVQSSPPKKPTRFAKPMSSAQPIGMGMGGTVQSPQPRSNQAGQTSPKHQKSIIFKKSAESHKQKGVMKIGQQMSSTKKGIHETRQDTTVMNQSTENSLQANSWQRQIKKQEETQTSWFDWFTCGTCTLQPELNEEMHLRKSAAESGRAPQMMQIQIGSKDILDIDNSSNDRSQTTSGMYMNRGGLPPQRTFDEFNNIIFDGEPPSGIKATEKNTVSGDEKVEKHLIQNMTHPDQKRQVLGADNQGDMSDSNLMLDIDEGTPKSERTQLLYTGREQPSTGFNAQSYSTQHQQFQKNPQEDVSSLRTNGQGGGAFSTHKKIADSQQTQMLSPVNAVGSGAKQRDTSPASYKHDYEKEIVRTKKGEGGLKESFVTIPSQLHKINDASAAKAVDCRQLGRGEGNLDTLNDSTISSNKSIPEEMIEENSSQLMTSHTHMSATEFPERSATAMAQPTKNSLSFSKQNTVQTQNEKSASHQNGIQTTYVSYSLKTTSEKQQMVAKQASLNRGVSVSESALIAEEHSATAGLEEESSCQQFRRLEQQIQAEDKQFNNVNSSRETETQEVAVVSVSMHPTEQNHPAEIDEDDEFLRVERECLAYQEQAAIQRQPSERQQTEYQQMFSVKTTPVCPTKNGPNATSAVKRNQFTNNRDEPAGNDHLLQEQMDEQSLQTMRDTSGIEFQINKFDSLNRSDNELLEGDTGRKFSQEHLAERHNHTSSGKRQGCNDSSDSGLINIQSAQLGIQPFNMVQPEELKYRKNENYNSQDESSILPRGVQKADPAPRAPAPAPQQTERLKPPLKTKVVSSLLSSMRKSPETYKEKSGFYGSKDPKKLTFGKQGISRQGSEQTFGASSPRNKVVGAKNKSSTLQQRSGYQNYQQKRPVVSTSKAQVTGKRQKPSLASSVKQTDGANVSGTDGHKSLEVHQTAMHATNSQQQTQQQGHNEESSQSQSTMQVPLPLPKQKSTTINSFSNTTPLNTTKQRTQSVYKPTAQQRSNLGLGLGAKRRSVSGMKKDALGKKNKVQEIFEKYANVTTIDLTARPRQGRSENRQAPIVELQEETKRESMANALRELNKSIRSASQVSILERQRSASRKSVHLNPSFAGSQVQPHKMASFNNVKNDGQNDRNSSAGKFGNSLHIDQKSPPFTHERPREKKGRLSVHHQASHNSMTGSQISSIQHDNKLTPSSKAGLVVARKQSSSLRPPNGRSSKTNKMEEIYRKYESKEQPSGEDLLKKAVRQMRKSFHSQSSRGRGHKDEPSQVQTATDRPQTNTDIYSDSIQMLNTERMSKQENSGKLYKDRASRTLALENAPMPRFSLKKRQRSPGVGSSYASQQTAMFGMMRKSDTQQTLAQTQRDYPAKALPPIPRMSKNQTDMPHSNLKEQLMEAARDKNAHFIDRQNSQLQHQIEFKTFRNSHKVKTDVLPSADEIQKFKEFTEAERKRLSLTKTNSQSVRQIAPSPRNRSNSNLNSTMGTPRSRTRQGMNGFFESRRSSAGNRRSLKKSPMPASKQQSGGNQAMFARRPPQYLQKAAMSRSMSPFTKKQEAVRQSSKRSLSVLNERSKERDYMASTSPVRLSKIMSQKEIATAKKFQIEVRRDSSRLGEIFQQRIPSTARSRSSRRNLSNSRGPFQAKQVDHEVKARLKPSVPRFSRPSLQGSASIKKVTTTTVAKKRPEITVLSVGVGSLNMPAIGSRTARAAAGTTEDSKMTGGLKNMNYGSTRQLRSGKPMGVTTTVPGRASIAKNTKVTLGQKTTTTNAGVGMAHKSRQVSSAQQFQSSFNNNNKTGSEAKNLRSAPRRN